MFNKNANKENKEKPRHPKVEAILSQIEEKDIHGTFGLGPPNQNNIDQK